MDEEFLNYLSAGYNEYSEEGNTVSSSLGGSSMRRACFTLNGYNNTDIEHIIKTCTERNYLYCFGEEIGDNGNPHLQGYIEFKNPKKFQTLKNFLPRAHWEKAKGNRKQNLTYTQKDGKYSTNFPIPVRQRLLRDVYNEVSWKDWQDELIRLHDQPPHPRAIHWFVDRIGNSGKTFVTKFLYLKHGVLVANGKKADVFHQIAKRYEDEENENPFRMAILDIPRHQSEFTNYGLLEEIKNGLIMSGKYEGGTVAFEVPHLVVMSNDEPDYTKFSMDRWRVQFLN
jgi:hypothetical protein